MRYRVDEGSLRVGRWLWWLVGLWLPVCGMAWAQEGAVAVEVLAQDPQWLRLLHAREGRGEILDAEFYLSPQGRDDPQAELRATLQALSAPWVEGRADQHPRCRFPARYHWLASRLDLPDYQSRDVRCARFEAWAQLDHLRSISLLEVSGYFGNPASSFGHALLRLDSDAPDSVAGLLDTSVNFGAMVPPNEWALVYVWKGLTGGYRSGFSDRLFHSHDQTYARNEFRDLWQFELDLNEDQRRLVVQHLWEVIGRKFTYYFLTENCAWRIGELVELALGRPVLPASSSPWFPPIELFFALQRQPGLVRVVRAMPSAERTLHHQLDQVRAEQRPALRQAMQDPGSSTALQGLDSASLEALLAYWDYRLTAVWPDVPTDLRQARDRVLRRRMVLPAGGAALAPLAAPMSPAAGNPPALLGVSGAQGPDPASGRVQLRLSPYFQDFLGFHGLDNSELVLLDTRIEADSQGHVGLGGLDLVRVRKLNSTSQDWPGLWHPTWHLRLGSAERESGATSWNEGLRGEAAGGAGAAWSWTPGVTAWAMVGLRAWQHPGAVRVEPELGVLVARSTWKALGQIRVDHDLQGQPVRPRMDLGVSHALRPGLEVRLEIGDTARGTHGTMSLYGLF